MSRTLTAASAALLLCLAVALPSALPAAASRDDVEREQDRVAGELDQSEADLEHVDGELVAAAGRLQELEAQVPGAQQAVLDADAAAEAARSKDAELAQEVLLAEAAVEVAGVMLQEREATAADTERVVVGVAREVYQGAGFDGLNMLLEARSAQEYTDMVSLAATARRGQQQALDRLQVQQVEIRNAEARLGAEQVRVEDLKLAAVAQVSLTGAAEQVARDAQAALETVVGEQSVAVARFEEARAVEEANQADLLRQQDDLQARLVEIAAAELRAEQERQARLAAEAAERERLAQEEDRRRAARDLAPQPRSEPAPAPAASGGGYLSTPVGGRVSSEFGYRVHPVFGSRRLHAGRDWAAACGTPVRAAADGTVVSAGDAGGYGNQVVLSHGVVSGSSLATSYSHLSEITVSSGPVTRGDVIGLVGTTGVSTGCHLHFETRESGAAVDPRSWL